jgi:Tol biopolymer transport system component
MMRKSLCLLLLVLSLALPGCGPLRVEASFKTPLQLTATALDQTHSTSSTGLGKLAYVQFGDIWIKDLSTGKERQLTQVGQDSEPRWSPSGQWLAFREDSHLWIERADGTDAHVVQGGATIGSFTWSPVEDRLAYTERGGLSVESADGGRLWQLVLPSGTAHGVRDFAWSPDGRWLAFDRMDRRRQGLWRVREEGASPQAVYRTGSTLELEGWSPDGASLLFWQVRKPSVSSMADGAPLLAVQVGNHRRHRLGQTLLYDDFLSWAPDGKQLALIQGGNRDTWNIKTLALATARGDLHPLQVDHSSASHDAFLYPAWSPNGRSIAVTRSPATRQTASGDVAGLAVQRRRIWLVAANGSTALQLTARARYRDERPEWSADGSAILFVRLGGKFAQLWLMQADGSHQRLVADNLAPGPSLGFWGYYGYVQWDQMYDWWTGRVQRPAP